MFGAAFASVSQSLYQPVSNTKVYAGKKAYSGQRRIKLGTAWISTHRNPGTRSDGQYPRVYKELKKVIMKTRSVISKTVRVEGGPMTGKRQILCSSSKRQERSQHSQPHRSLSGDYGASLHKSHI